MKKTLLTLLALTTLFGCGGEEKPKAKEDNTLENKATEPKKDHTKSEATKTEKVNGSNVTKDEVEVKEEKIKEKIQKEVEEDKLTLDFSSPEAMTKSLQEIQALGQEKMIAFATATGQVMSRELSPEEAVEISGDEAKLLRFYNKYFSKKTVDEVIKMAK